MTEYYKQQLADGKAFEQYVKQQLAEKRQLHLDILHGQDLYDIGETRQGYEIKYDKRYKDTGNLYIETKEKSNPANPNYVASGIFRQDNTHTWIIGDYKQVYMFDKKTLVEVYEQDQYFRYVSTATSHGFLLNQKLIDEYKIDHIYFE